LERDNTTEEGVFFKNVSKSPKTIPRDQKAALNRRGNELYNAGHIEEARRIFLTTGYSDGITRIGDYYKSHGRLMDALRMYWIAPDHKKADEIIVQLAMLVKNLIQRED
jgi:hypothetical protein